MKRDRPSTLKEPRDAIPQIAIQGVWGAFEMSSIAEHISTGSVGATSQPTSQKVEYIVNPDLELLWSIARHRHMFDVGSIAWLC